MADLDQESLTLLSRLLLEAVDDEGLRPLLTDIARVWSEPTVQLLLLEETSGDGRLKVWR